MDHDLLILIYIHGLFVSCMKVLRGLLKSSDVDLRITAGETMVLLLEAVYEYDEVSPTVIPANEICNTLVILFEVTGYWSYA